MFFDFDNIFKSLINHALVIVLNLVEYSVTLIIITISNNQKQMNQTMFYKFNNYFKANSQNNYAHHILNMYVTEW